MTNPVSRIKAQLLWACSAGILLVATSPSFADFSGDASIDTYIPYIYNVRAGGNSAGINRGQNTTNCASAQAPAFESKCPNDATYAPSQYTGGYQAWGVGLAAYYADTIGFDCGWEFVLNWDSWPLPILQYVCSYEIGQVIDGYFGVARVRLKWGEDNSTTAQYSSIHPTSVLAFNASSLTPCDIGTFVLNPDCSNSDSAYIEDSGYEAEIVFADPACGASLVTGRDGGANDSIDGCFVYYSGTQISELPADYKDTTFGDPPYTFNIGMGSSNAAAIEPGLYYNVTQFFSSSAGHLWKMRLLRHTPVRPW